MNLDSEDHAWGSIRVWKEDHLSPGLAMSRSIGDTEAHTVGVISVPDVLEIELKRPDRAIVLASDGIWEVLSNERVAKIVADNYKDRKSDKAAETLVKAATLEWKKKGGEIDDITVIVIFLKSY